MKLFHYHKFIFDKVFILIIHITGKSQICNKAETIRKNKLQTNRHFFSCYLSWIKVKKKKKNTMKVWGRGFFRPPADINVVGRRKLLASGFSIINSKKINFIVYYYYIIQDKRLSVPIYLLLLKRKLINSRKKKRKSLKLFHLFALKGKNLKEKQYL